MARPSRQASCHPEKKHRAHGLCNNCYINKRHNTPEGKRKRHEYYLTIKEEKKAKSKANYNNDRARQVGLAVIRTRKRRQAGKVYVKREVPVSDLPRETIKGSCDKNWWKPTDKEIPNSWRMNT